MHLFENLNIDFLGKRKIAYVISGTLLLLGLISLALRGLELGIDFKGGTEIALEFEKPIDISEIRDQVNAIGLGNVEVKTFGAETGVLLRTELQEIPAEIFPKVKDAIEKEIDKGSAGVAKTVVETTPKAITYQFADANIASAVADKLFKNGFQTTVTNESQVIVRVGIADWLEEVFRANMPDNKFSLQKEDQVGPKIGDELKQDSILAVLLALVVILLYLGLRFKFVFAMGAVVALFHDVMITLGLFSMLYGVIPGLNLEITVSVVAAFLTLVGYSINDTVVVFDRVRENIKIHKTAELADNINNAINKTMRRTIVTSLTTLFVVISLLLFGGDVLRGFAFTMFFGIVIGTYSSIFVASAVVYEYSKKSTKKIQFN